jgi:ParB family chromosome partitioning protein
MDEINTNPNPVPDVPVQPLEIPQEQPKPAEPVAPPVVESAKPTAVVPENLPASTRDANKTDDDSTRGGPTPTMMEVGIDLIKPNPWQPRKNFDEQALQELSASIKEHGILQPLVVVPAPDGSYQLIMGERRLRASKLAGLTKVPVVIHDYMEEHRKLELALIENIQRHNLNPIEEAFAYKQLVDEYRMTQDEVAKKVGKGRTTITNMLRLLHLPLKIQNAIIEGTISEGHARAILSMMGMEKQIALFDMVVSQGMTVRQVEEKVREMLERPKVIRTPRGPSDPEVSALENEIRGKLGTKVKVQKSGESGKITIEFFSKDELDNFMAKLNKMQS